MKPSRGTPWYPLDPCASPCLLIALVCLAALVNGQEGARARQAKQLQECINTDFKLEATVWNASILHDTPANLYLEGIWWTEEQPKFDFTVITQLSLDRVHTLVKQCSSYNGPISAAVFLALTQNPSTPVGEGEPALLSSLWPSNAARIAEAKQQLAALHTNLTRSDNKYGCQLDLMFFWELFVDVKSQMLYPVNSLRNYARMQVRTELVSAIDVDMMISHSLQEQLSDPAQFALIRESALQKRAVVLPAFEPTRVGPVGRDYADKAAHGDKANLEYMYKKKHLMQFKLKVFSRGHTPTDYVRFFNQTEMYTVKYKHMYEPWFITSWASLPWFDVRFRGYGMNKIAHVASLNLYNFTFIVNPGVWIIHAPHSDTDVRKVVAREASNVNKYQMKLGADSLYYKVTKLFGEVKRAMLAGTFEARRDARMDKCFQQIPWLQPMPKFTPHALPASTFVT